MSYNQNPPKEEPSTPGQGPQLIATRDLIHDAWEELEPSIESALIPRLMMAFRNDSQLEEDAAAPAAVPDQASARQLAELVLSENQEVACQYIQSLRAGGASLKSIYLKLVTDAAQGLGQQWVDDEISFFDVTVGVSRLQQVMLEFSACFCAEDGRREVCEQSALIAPLPGEQHSFGAFMVVEFFRRAGWNVRGGAPASLNQLCDAVAEQHFDLVGLSLSADRHLDQLASVVQALRKASTNPELKIMIGGRCALDQTSLWEDVAADGVSVDAADAVTQADQLISRV
ncbi:MAG: cobalamin-dependent protein [Pseudomonadota bacterium]